jgi:hypothetical protein
LPVLDNFERAKTQINVETEGEEKINNSYQSIYKQFTEILNSLGVEDVETIGKPFDPMVSSISNTCLKSYDCRTPFFSYTACPFFQYWIIVQWKQVVEAIDYLIVATKGLLFPSE